MEVSPLPWANFILVDSQIVEIEKVNLTACYSSPNTIFPPLNQRLQFTSDTLENACETLASQLTARAGDSLAVFLSQNCVGFFEHWKSVRKDGALVPLQSDFLDHPHPLYAPHLYIIEMVGRNLIIRLMGTRLVERWGRDRTGEDLLKDQPDNFRDVLLANGMTADSTPCGFKTVIEFASTTGNRMLIEALSLPLDTGQENVVRRVTFSEVAEKRDYQDFTGQYLGTPEAEWVDVGAGIPDQPPLNVKERPQAFVVAM